MQIFVTFSLTRRQPACARTTADKGGKKQTKKGRRNGARSRRIIKCVLPRKFIFILESIIRKRRHARTRERKRERERERETFLPLFERLSLLSAARVVTRSLGCIPFVCYILLSLASRLRGASEKPRGYVVDYRDCTLKLTVTRLYIRNARTKCLNQERIQRLGDGKWHAAAKSKIQNRRRAILKS